MNSAYLYSLNKLPEDGADEKELSESECNIPLIYRILVSQNAIATKSIFCDDEDDDEESNVKIAITGDYEKGVAKLCEYFEKAKSFIDKEKKEKILAFLNDETNKQKYIHLECGEIYEMNDEDAEIQNEELLEELKNIDGEIEKSLECLAEGDMFDLRELDEDYWTDCI